MTCNHCGGELEVGDWPWCPHGSIHESRAQRFDPIVVHVDAQGNYRFPASTDAPVPAGYTKREITTLREADRITREVNTREDATLHAVQHQSETSRSLTRRRNREFMDSMRSRLSPFGRQFLDQAREYQAQKDQRRQNTRTSANFHMDVFANDSSNRESHSDERTGWRSRKG